MVRVSANFSIPRDDVFEETVKAHRSAGSFNKLLTTLLITYHDNPEVGNLIDAKMSGIEKNDKGALEGLLNKMRSTLAQSDMLIEDGQFAREGYSQEVQDGLEGVLGENNGVSTENSPTNEGESTAVKEEISEIKEDISELKTILKSFMLGMSSGNNVFNGTQNSNIAREWPGSESRGTKHFSDFSVDTTDGVRSETENVTSETQNVDSEIKTDTLETENDIKDNNQEEIEIPTDSDDIIEISDEPTKEEEFMDDSESDDLMESLLGSGVFK